MSFNFEFVDGHVTSIDDGELATRTFTARTDSELQQKDQQSQQHVQGMYETITVPSAVGIDQTKMGTFLPPHK